MTALPDASLMHVANRVVRGVAILCLIPLIPLVFTVAFLFAVVASAFDHDDEE